MQNQFVLWIVGLPATGKSALADAFKLITPAEAPQLRHIDIDDVRRFFMGTPALNDGTDPEIEKRDVAEMSEAWNMMFAWTERVLERGWPCIFTGTLSSKRWGQDRLWEIRKKHPLATVRVVWCKIDIKDPKALRAEIERRLAKRQTEGYCGGTGSFERWKVLAERYNPIEIPHLAVDTARNDPFKLAHTVRAYIDSEQPFDLPS